MASRHPLWEDRLHEGSGHSSVERGLVLDEGKETLGTTVLDAEPDVILPMPEDSPWPFLTTLAMTAGFGRPVRRLIPLLPWLRRPRLPRRATLASLGLLLAPGGCEEAGVGTRFTAVGDPDQGALLIDQIGRGSCHMIPGIDAAEGLVGPPLDHMGKRIFIAGLLRNTPANMVTWLLDPQGDRARQCHARHGPERGAGARHHGLPLHPQLMIGAAIADPLLLG